MAPLCVCVVCEPGCLTVHGACEISPVYATTVAVAAGVFRFTSISPTSCTVHTSFTTIVSLHATIVSFFGRFTASSKAAATGNPAACTENHFVEVLHKKMDDSLQESG